MIKLYNRKTCKYEVEKVAGEKFLEFLYSSKIGQLSLNFLVKRKIFSSLTGIYCDMKISKKKIESFVKNYNIDICESKKNINEFNTFNEFFIRELKDKSRDFTKRDDVFMSPGDGRIQIWEDIDIDKVVQVKNINYRLKDLIGSEEISDIFKGGVCILLRLAPVDYHRFHFIDDGVANKSKLINGYLYSVNPIALKKIPKIFCENKREYTIFESDNYGIQLYVEVGATSVGSIIQTYNDSEKIKRGMEKGYFKFGGSTIILFVEKEKVIFDNDIIKNTKEGIETRVFAGEQLGKKIL